MPDQFLARLVELLPLLVLELALSTSAMMLWRILYTATNPDPR